MVSLRTRYYLLFTHSYKLRRNSDPSIEMRMIEIGCILKEIVSSFLCGVQNMIWSQGVTTEQTSGCLLSDAYEYSIPFSFRVIGPKIAV